MRVLSMTHEATGTGAFGTVIAERGHEHVVWRVDEDDPPSGEFGAVLVFGGTQNTHEDDIYPWLKGEINLIARIHAERAPIFGICLGGQLLAKALGAAVTPSSSREVGWYDVRVERGREDDPVLGALPGIFRSFQWHYYEFEVPEGAVPIARSATCLQGFRAGDVAWGVQFHPEVTRKILQGWFDHARSAGQDNDYPTLESESDRYAAGWTELGRIMCGNFMAVAERNGVSVQPAALIARR